MDSSKISERLSCEEDIVYKNGGRAGQKSDRSRQALLVNYAIQESDLHPSA